MNDSTQRRPWYRGDISLGNILTIIGMAIAGTGAWIDVRTTQAEIIAQQADYERRLVSLERSELERRTDRLNQVTLVTEIRADIRYLREAVERIEEERAR